jgi:diaminohydroxyphosphoribosylaminopyrimidine deaminase/5-amino-6-(5-phosphoribosylamino)uracil reductase
VDDSLTAVEMPDHAELSDEEWMRIALRLAARGRGRTSPNPCVGAVLVGKGGLVGQGWHRRAGLAHAEIEALRDAEARGNKTAGATLYVTLEPCSTTGRTPPCTEAILAAGIKRVVVAAVDPNPSHAGRGLEILRGRGLAVTDGVLSRESARMNEAFNHWIVTGRPFVTLKAAMTLDGRIATRDGQSKWITGPESGRHAMRLRRMSDAILVGVNTVLADDPSLTCRQSRDSKRVWKRIRRIVLDTKARTPLTATLVGDEHAEDTVIVVGERAAKARVDRLKRRVEVWSAPTRDGRVDLCWVLERLGREGVTRLLVEGGGEVNGAFIDHRLAQRVAFFYAPKILGGIDACRGVGGTGFESISELPRIASPEWRRFGEDLFLTGLIEAA